MADQVQEINFADIVGPTVQDYMKGTNTPGMSAAIVYTGETCAPFSFGFIDKKKSAAVTETTIFGLGSVTKVFTSILLQSAVNADKMDLTDYVTKYLPPEVGEQGTDISSVTLQDLATHTAGMPDEGGSQPASTLFTDEPPSQKLIQWWEAFQAQPAIGTCWRYSNIGFVTLGYAVGGYKPNQYNQQLASVITTPLNMPHTASSVSGETVAQGYKGNPETTTRVHKMPADLKSNAVDMQTFLNACVFPDQQSSIGSAILGTQKIYYKGNNCDGNATLKFQMGLAWQIFEMTSGNNSYQLLAKDGEAGGYDAWIGVIPDLTGVVLLSNKYMVASPAPNNIEATGRSILQQILDAMNG
jgi:beta-lactamase class C